MNAVSKPSKETIEKLAEYLLDKTDLTLKEVLRNLAKQDKQYLLECMEKLQK